ncbi:MAG: PHB depolymerase family esterase [Dehalococcoidia bacterium]
MRLAWPLAVALVAIPLAVLALAVAVPGCQRHRADADPDPGPTVTETPTPDVDGPEPLPIGPGRHDDAIPYEGRNRRFVLFVPESYDGTEAAPLVLVLHPADGDADQMIEVSGFVDMAERYGFLLVFPEGTAPFGGQLFTWNAGNCCGYAMERQVDDVGFLRALIDHLAGRLTVDSRRIYAAGISNGGMLAYRLACEMADVLAAVAPVSGALNVEVCDPAQPISLIAFHGTEDSYVPYEGGTPEVILDGNERVDRSVAESVGFFLQRNGCPAEADRSTAGLVHTDRYEPCVGGTSVVLVTIEGGGHAWPGGERSGSLTDVPTRWPDATEEIWKFFAEHPRPD